MNREQKQTFVQELKNGFQDSSATFIVKVQGLTVIQIEGLRKLLRKEDSRLKVAKDRLVKLAIKENSAASGLMPYLKEQIAVVFSSKDSASTAKILNDFTKKSKLDIVAGLVESDLYDKSKVVRLASLPSREVLLSQLCGLLNAPVSKLAYAVSLIAEQKGGASTKSNENVEEKNTNEAESAS